MKAAQIARVESRGTREAGSSSRGALLKRLLLVFACPGEVFEEVVSSPPRLANWLVPTALVAAASLLVLAASNNPEQAANATGRLVQTGALSPVQAAEVATDWNRTSVIVVITGGLAGSLWSALVLWGIGRLLLRARFSYAKALEVVGLTGGIAVLGAVETALLIKICGDGTARPALSLVARGLAADHPLRLMLDQVNLFYLWSTAVLAIGLSRLSGVSFKQTGFWVFGYWVLARIAGVLLGGP